MYKNNSARFGQIGIEAEKKVYLELFRYWMEDGFDGYVTTEEELEQEFRNAIRDGEIIEM